MQSFNTVGYQQLGEFHCKLARLLAHVFDVCDWFRYSEAMYNYSGDDEGAPTVDLESLAERQAARLAELQKLLAELKSLGDFLAWLTPTDRLPFTEGLDEYWARDLATRFLLSLGDRPRGYHEVALDLMTGCLEELRTAAGDPNEAAKAAESWREVFTFAGGSIDQWRLHLRAENARARDPDAHLTAEERRQKFAYEASEAGWSYKEINNSLRDNSPLGGYANERGVRGPIEQWARRIDAAPRKGHPRRSPQK